VISSHSATVLDRTKAWPGGSPRLGVVADKAMLLAETPIARTSPAARAQLLRDIAHRRPQAPRSKDRVLFPSPRRATPAGHRTHGCRGRGPAGRGIKRNRLGAFACRIDPRVMAMEWGPGFKRNGYSNVCKLFDHRNGFFPIFHREEEERNLAAGIEMRRFRTK